jgi:hypothetical protein
VSQPLLCQAIRELRTVRFIAYSHERIGQPHLLGQARDGTLQLELFQTGGHTSGRTGRLPQWRRFNLRDIRDLVLLDQIFTPRSDFNPRRKEWQPVLAQV